MSAARCTFATLTTCGHFDFFDRFSEMNRFPERRAMVVASPFDYARQGELRIAPMSNSPKSPDFSEELCRTLPSLLREHQYGRLVLFTRGSLRTPIRSRSTVLCVEPCSVRA